MLLYLDKKRAPNPRKLRMYLAEKQLDIPIKELDLYAGDQKTPEFLAKNPFAGVPILELDDGTVAVAHLVQHDSTVTPASNPEAEGATFTVEGDFCRRKPNLMSVFKQLLPRGWVLFIGRFKANLTRSIIQKMAITGKPKLPYRFKREIILLAETVKVNDYFPENMPLKRISIGSDATSIYVANSLTHQESRLCPWQHANLENIPVENGWRVWRRTYHRGSGHDPQQR